MTKGYKNLYIWWRWQHEDNNWLGVAYSQNQNNIACWFWDPKYGRDGHNLWKRRKPGKLIVICNKTKTKYTNAIELFARKCKEKLRQKFFAKKFRLNQHIINNSNNMHLFYAYMYLLHNLQISSDVVSYIQLYLPIQHINIHKYLYSY